MEVKKVQADDLRTCISDVDYWTDMEDESVGRSGQGFRHIKNLDCDH